MKNAYLLSLALFMSLPAVAYESTTQEFYDMEKGMNEYHQHDKERTKKRKSNNSPDLASSPSINRGEHNPRHIFLCYMLNKGQNKKTAHTEEPVLPMMTQDLRYLVGSYAREIPTQYKIESYLRVPFGRFQSLFGSLILNPETTGIVLKQAQKKPDVPILVTPIEAEFFKEQQCHWSSVSYEYSDNNRIEVLIPMLGAEDLDCLARNSSIDKMTLKLRNTDSNKALKAAALLPRKKKK